MIKEGIDQGITYKTYRRLHGGLVRMRKTSGEKQSEALSHYTLMNHKRMERLDKTIQLNETSLTAIRTVKRRMHWLVLSEAWCGDAAQILPYMNAIAEQSEDIQLSILWRDEQPKLMEEYHTNGSLSIPKLIAVDMDTMEVLGSWGPRPEYAQNMVMKSKEEGENYEDLSKRLQLWYAKDRGNSIQAELAQCILDWSFNSAKKAS